MIHSTVLYTAPEWDNYWVKWKIDFEKIETRGSRIELYKELIRDLKNK